MPDAPVTLRSELLEMELAPSVGGAVARLDWFGGGGRSPILRASPSPLEKVLDSACFPLVPFSNRIRDGRFAFRDRQVRLAANMAGDPSPLHGQGWTGAWTVERALEDEAVLAFEHEAGAWPWAYFARQHFRLEANAVHCTISCVNRSAEPMPCGLGFHPYFPCGPGTRIETDVDEVWTIDKLVLPVAREPATGRYAIGGDPVCGRGLDNGYGGWSGRALLTDPAWAFGLEMSSPDARFFQLYSPASGGLFVAEPVSHANAALNAPEPEWPSLGMQVLEPGHSMDLTMRLAVQARG